ncbi:hypothetical protein ABGB08_54460, partial [Acrocarpospora sp. B8E8]
MVRMVPAPGITASTLIGSRPATGTLTGTTGSVAGLTGIPIRLPGSVILLPGIPTGPLRTPTGFAGTLSCLPSTITSLLSTLANRLAGHLPAARGPGPGPGSGRGPVAAEGPDTGLPGRAERGRAEPGVGGFSGGSGG